MTIAQNRKNIRLIGALAIMSDKQISDFKNKYINYLSSLKVAKKNDKYGISYNGVYIKNRHVINFLEKILGCLTHQTLAS